MLRISQASKAWSDARVLMPVSGYLMLRSVGTPA